MSETHSKGTKLRWNWGNGTAEGKVEDSFTQDVTRTIKGNEVTRKASADKPAYLIKQDDGDIVLKSHSEVEKV